MIVLRGIASKVSHEVVREPVCEGGFVEAHISTFRIGASLVRLKMYEDWQAIRDGDQVAVAGPLGGDLLNVLAYENNTTRRSGNAGKLMSVAVGLVLLLVAVVASRDSLFATAAMGIAGLCGCIQGIRIAVAERAITSAASDA